MNGQFVILEITLKVRRYETAPLDHGSILQWVLRNCEILSN